MSQKRGRPVSGDTAEPAVLRQRERWRERQTQSRGERCRRTAAQTRVTEDQRRQEEQVINYIPGAQDIDEAPTPPEHGLRVSSIQLEGDEQNITTQQDAAVVHEYEDLYNRPSSSTAADDPVPGNYDAQVSPPPPTLQRSPNLNPDLPSLSRRPLSILSRPPINTAESSYRLPLSIPIRGRGRGRPRGSMKSSTSSRQRISGSPESRRRTIRDFLQQTPRPSPISSIAPPSIDRFRSPLSFSNSPEIAQSTATFESDPNNYSDDRVERSDVELISEQSSDHDDDSEGSNHQAPPTATERTADYLFHLFQHGLTGCTDEQHQQRSIEHTTSTEACTTLESLIHDAVEFPSVLSSSRFLKLSESHLPSIPSAARWEKTFCGIDSTDSNRPIHVCLHSEQTAGTTPQVRFDVDSIHGFASSLAFARRGIRYLPTPQFKQNLQTDLHIKSQRFRSIDDDGRQQQTSMMLKDIPHFFFGWVQGVSEIAVYILFPHLPVTGNRFHCLTNDQMTVWLDDIFNPALHQYIESGYSQHLPSTYDQATRDSRAAQTEARFVRGSAYQTAKAIAYHLQPEELDLVWHQIGNLISDNDLKEFRDPQIFFSAKGEKLQFKGNRIRTTLVDVMQHFQDYLNDFVNKDFIFLDRFYIDIGKEICPDVSHLPDDRLAFDEEPQVYLWKRCCLESHFRSMYDHPPAQGSAGQRYYHHSMLHEAASVTSLTPKRSLYREGGLIYSQAYNSVKEIFDAAKHFPLVNEGLEEMAIDPLIRKGTKQLIAGRGREEEVIREAYGAGKMRVDAALTGSRQKSYGVREEVRVTWPLFQELFNRSSVEPPELREVVLPDCPSSVWPIRTARYLDFLRYNANKFAAGFELMLAQCPRNVITWEQTKMMAMFLRCLRFSLVGHQLQRESALWWSHRQFSDSEGEETKTWHGLGFCNTLPRYGYCWLEPKIDWSRLIFKPEVTEHVLFGNSVLRNRYLRRGGQVREFQDLNRQLDLALAWLDEYRDRVETVRRLTDWAIHICLQQFRRDVMDAVKKDILPEHREEACRGNEPFSYDWFESIMEEEPWLVSGNRSDNKEPNDLASFLFKYHDHETRTGWEDRAYRTMYQRVCRRLAGIDRGLQRLFVRRFTRHFKTFHWIWPYPSRFSFSQTTKQGRRMWYSFKEPPALGGVSRHARVEALWIWGQKSWQRGRPDPLPPYIKWTREEWERWIEESRAVERAR